MSLLHHARQIATRVSIRSLSSLLRSLSDSRITNDAPAKYTRWVEAEPFVESFLALSETERTKILSTDLGQYIVGTANAATRDAWVAKVLTELSP